jgi:DNA-binding transcriptional ArsR family regulator
LPIYGKLPILGNSIYWAKYRLDTEEQIARLLPRGWRTSFRDQRGMPGVDATVELSAPDGAVNTVAVEFKTELTPTSAEPAWRTLMATGKPGLLVAPRISKRTQEYLRRRDIAYVDLIGNAYWRLDSPALFISIHADGDAPKVPLRGRRLRGKKAGRLIRYLCDTKPPHTVGELASALAVDPGNVSRYLDLLSKDGLIKRASRGTVTDVDWEGVLRRWSEDYRRPAGRSFMDPRGAEHFLKRLQTTKDQYVLSGVTAATRYAPYTVQGAVLCYCNDVRAFAETFGLQGAEQSANVLLAVPFDEVVSAHTEMRDGLILAAPAQVAIDLLTGRGREVSQAEELIRWMRETENDWRS